MFNVYYSCCSIHIVYVYVMFVSQFFLLDVFHDRHKSIENVYYSFKTACKSNKFLFTEACVSLNLRVFGIIQIYEITLHGFVCSTTLKASTIFFVGRRWYFYFFIVLSIEAYHIYVGPNDSLLLCDYGILSNRHE